MKIKILRIAQSAVFFALIGVQSSNVESKTDKLKFFDEMDTVVISSRAKKLVILLESFVLPMRKGDRRVRRYFAAYSTPFFGGENKASNYSPVYRDERDV